MNLFDKVQTARHLQTREDLSHIEDDWIIEGLIPTAQAGVLIAPMKSMKSSVTMQMAEDVSTGNHFFGLKTKQVKTLILDNEDTDRELNKRLRNKREASDDLYFLTGGEFKLDNHYHMQLLSKFIKDNNIKFVIFDNLMTMFPKSKLYTDEFGAMLDKITTMKLFFQDVTFIIVAHANKAVYAQSMREKSFEVNPAEALGGSELTAWAEFMLILSPKQGNHHKYSKLTVEARGYQFEDDLNFAYVDSVFTCVNKSKKEPDSELVEEVKKQTPLEVTKESAQAFLDLVKEQGKVIEND